MWGPQFRIHHSFPLILHRTLTEISRLSPSLSWHQIHHDQLLYPFCYISAASHGSLFQSASCRPHLTHHSLVSVAFNSYLTSLSYSVHLYGASWVLWYLCYGVHWCTPTELGYCNFPFSIACFLLCFLSFFKTQDLSLYLQCYDLSALAYKGIINIQELYQVVLQAWEEWPRTSLQRWHGVHSIHQ